MFREYSPHLLSTVRRKVEYKYCEEGDAHARDDEIDSVEECFASHCDIKCNIKVWLSAAGIMLDISSGWHL